MVSLHLVLCDNLLPVACKVPEGTRSYFERQLEELFAVSLLFLKLYPNAFLSFLHQPQGVIQRRLVKKLRNESIIYYDGTPFPHMFLKLCLVPKASLWGFLWLWAWNKEHLGGLPYITEVKIHLGADPDFQHSEQPVQQSLPSPSWGNQASLQPDTHSWLMLVQMAQTVFFTSFLDRQLRPKMIAWGDLGFT